jgi:DNA-binding MarR family transcriptional regulator
MTVDKGPAGSVGAPGAADDDPTVQSRWRPLFRLLSDMDDEIARIYHENGIPDLKPSWVLEIIRLHLSGPMTIAELARSVGRTHSAMSQKVAAMRAAGWLVTTPGPDARSKKVTLAPKAEAIADKLAIEWRATEATIAELEDELPYPLSRAADDLARLLAARSFHDRIAARLAQHPAWSAPRDA